MLQILFSVCLPFNIVFDTFIICKDYIFILSNLVFFSVILAFVMLTQVSSTPSLYKYYLNFLLVLWWFCFAHLNFIASEINFCVRWEMGTNYHFQNEWPVDQPDLVIHTFCINLKCHMHCMLNSRLFSHTPFW